jgi:hypothetical protein
MTCAHQCATFINIKYIGRSFLLNKKSWALLTQLLADATGWHLTGYADQVAPLALRRCLSAGLPHILLLSLCT